MKTKLKERIEGIGVTIQAEKDDNIDLLRQVAMQAVPIVHALDGNWEIEVIYHWFYLHRDGGTECLNTTSGITIAGHIEDRDKFYFSVPAIAGKYVYDQPKDFGEKDMRSAKSKAPATIAKEIQRRIIGTAEKYAAYWRSRMADAMQDEQHQLRLIQKYQEVFQTVPSSRWERELYENRIKEAVEKGGSWGCNYAGASLVIPHYRTGTLTLTFSNITEEETDTLMMWYKIMKEEQKSQ
mgnify:CR=1 FL=1